LTPATSPKNQQQQQQQQASLLADSGHLLNGLKSRRITELIDNQQYELSTD
jgi:hypothetical protein